MKTQVKEKKSQKEIDEEKAAEREAMRKDMEEEDDPQLTAAKQQALEAREEADAAEKRAKDAEDEVEALEILRETGAKENLDAQDQGAIQGTTRQGIETIR